MNFHYLVRAIIPSANNILLVREIGASNTFLPGGHIEFGESAKSALRRELIEELGISIDIIGFCGAVEHQWGNETDRHAEINLVFKAIIPDFDNKLSLESKEPHLEFLWVPKASLASHNLLPSPMIEMVNDAATNNQAFWGSTLEQK
ncbi:NUDIX domain-containing protein [Desulfogranum mediterraneum]|uniref:NUDIX domain-containing protein n=1 Tax=Desulfogranum mediterraneum TaxID=160661 RepID=UPI0005545C6D|nr:NUDIX domain-containing protein [Desulfogranum mediterraneum]